MTDKIFIVDTETNIKNVGEDAVGKMKASPFHPDNHIVYIGAINETSTSDVNTRKLCGWPISVGDHTYEMLVGHNIKFDLLYMMKDVDNFREHDWPNIQIWDTMLAEYLLSGQTKFYPSLDYCSEKYGGVLKDDRVKDFWDSGVDTEDIPEEIITPYLENDVLNTRLVFREQVKKAKELGMLTLIKTQMQALKATTEMEWNGMCFDLEVAYEQGGDLRDECKDIEVRVQHNLPVSNELQHVINLNSNQQIAAILYGGTIKTTTTQAVLNDDGSEYRYKTGKRKGEVKTKIVVENVAIDGYGLTPPFTTASGLPATSDKALQKLLDESTGTLYASMYDAHDFIEDILTIRKLNKDISTYYVGYSELAWKQPDGTYIIHQNLSHVSTATGRLSCTQPNLQNVTSKEE